MPYVERVTRAGKTIEVERYFTSRYKKPGIKRGDKVKPTKEEQKKVNTRAAERKLRLLLNANFGYGDYHLELDYIRKKGQPDRSREQMRKDMDIFLRELRKECKKAGIELKYVHVMEIGKRGARHHHLVINRTEADGALQGKRWNCSKNLVRPEPEIRIISDRAWFKSEPTAIKGYYVDKDSVSKGVHSPEYYGYGYMRYTLVKLE